METIAVILGAVVAAISGGGVMLWIWSISMKVDELKAVAARKDTCDIRHERIDKQLQKLDEIRDIVIRMEPQLKTLVNEGGKA